MKAETIDHILNDEEIKNRLKRGEVEKPFLEKSSGERSFKIYIGNINVQKGEKDFVNQCYVSAFFFYDNGYKRTEVIQAGPFSNEMVALEEVVKYNGCVIRNGMSPKQFKEETECEQFESEERAYDDKRKQF